MRQGVRIGQKQHTRTVLVRAALVRFARDGLAEAKTSDIAAAAKVSHGTVFVHFSSRESLLSAAIEEFGAKITKRLHELVEGGSSVGAVLRAHLEGLAQFEPFYTRLVTQATVIPVAARSTMVMIQSAISFHLSQAAEHEMAAGSIRRMPLSLLFNTWLGLVHYYVANKDVFSPRSSVLKRLGPELVRHYMTLISA